MSDTLQACEEQARYNVAACLENVLGSDDFQCGELSPVEFVEGGAWVTVRVWTGDVFSPGKCVAQFEGEFCEKPLGHDGLHVSRHANWGVRS
jgi:hypothetical protein